MVEGFATLFAQMEHGAKLRGDVLSQRRVAAMKGAQLLEQLRASISGNIGEIERALAQFRETHGAEVRS